MRRKNQRLVIIFISLLLVNLAFLIFSGKNKGVSFDENKFVLEDTTTISAVRLESKNMEILLEKSSGDWQLNREHGVDEGLKRLLLSIMQRVRVKRPVSIDVSDEATLVRISGDNPMSFYVWGNPTKTSTYFSFEDSEEVYEVDIPGYNEYLGQIFELNSDQWRDRLLIDASWRTIQKLTLDYLEEDSKSFAISFEDSFYQVTGLSSIDSSAVIDYLNQFQYFEVNEWISKGRFHRYDSLSRMPPLATLTIETINEEEPYIFRLYRSFENEPYHLVADKNNNLMVIDQRRMLGLLRNRSDFQAEDK